MTMWGRGPPTGERNVVIRYITNISRKFQNIEKVGSGARGECG